MIPAYTVHGLQEVLAPPATSAFRVALSGVGILGSHHGIARCSPIISYTVLGERRAGVLFISFHASGRVSSISKKTANQNLWPMSVNRGSPDLS